MKRVGGKVYVRAASEAVCWGNQMVDLLARCSVYKQGHLVAAKWAQLLAQKTVPLWADTKEEMKDDCAVEKMVHWMVHVEVECLAHSMVDEKVV